LSEQAGLKFDFIIIHESDMNGLLIISLIKISRYVDSREFTNYSESLLWNYYGKKLVLNT
jgi:hypothetical protein